MNDREKLIALIREGNGGHDFMSLERIADHLIAYGVVVHEKGEWKPVENWSDCVCSKCDWMYVGFWASDWNFCPNCGADMRKEN